MHEAAGEEGARDRQRRLARRRALAAERDEALLAALPPVGTVVEGLVLEALLGQGGFGTVYLARRDEQTVAVKFIYLPQAADWALRELGALVRLETVGGVGLRGHGLWPPDKPVFQFIVMEYVDGWELYTWARHHNPHALEAVGVLLDLTRELGAAHSVGVIHRDLKGDNVLVRAADGRALLVDFGVATWPGVPRLTGPQVPGCREYLSPEVVRYNRGEREQHQASGLDDLWALGVVAYQLLTGTYPFQGHNAAELERAILHDAPQPPHVRNPRVPRALSEVCMRLLEKEPGARYPDARALHTALQEVKRGADELWKVPLCEAWGPDAAPTRVEVALVTEERVRRLERVLEYERRHPRRGEPWPEKQVQAPPPAAEAVSPPAGEQRVDAADSRPPWWVLVAGLGLVLLVGLLVELSSVAVQLARVPTLSPVGTPRADLPRESFPIALEPNGQEVAPPWRRLEGGEGTAPSEATIPAPVASATLLKDSSRVKTARNAPPLPREDRQQAPTKGTTGKAGVAAVCALLSGCTGAPQVRPPPEPVDCPAETVKTMEELGVFSRTGPYNDEVLVSIAARALGDITLTIQGGPVTVTLLDDTGKLPVHSTLSGQLIVGKERVYGRFTQATTPRGDTFPVCFQFHDWSKPGVRIVEAGPGPELARINSGQLVTPVTRFE
ncbi:protein kinase domain-containing protein [Archangium sp.]|uniref:serine/threonine protein kinase n=1 Tax=Archangium sp. TaxID=1872627 RepID=UPI00286C6934|nr:protein kinase [Archangium sp.]